MWNFQAAVLRGKGVTGLNSTLSAAFQSRCTRGGSLGGGRRPFTTAKIARTVDAPRFTQQQRYKSKRIPSGLAPLEGVEAAVSRIFRCVGRLGRLDAKSFGSGQSESVKSSVCTTMAPIFPDWIEDKKNINVESRQVQTWLTVARMKWFLWRAGMNLPTESIESFNEFLCYEFSCFDALACSLRDSRELTATEPLTNLGTSASVCRWQRIRRKLQNILVLESPQQTVQIATCQLVKGYNVKLPNHGNAFRICAKLGMNSRTGKVSECGDLPQEFFYVHFELPVMPNPSNIKVAWIHPQREID